MTWDALDRLAFCRPTHKSERNHETALDLLVGYAMRWELTHGWWERAQFLRSGPMRGHCRCSDSGHGPWVDVTPEHTCILPDQYKAKPLKFVRLANGGTLHGYAFGEWHEAFMFRYHQVAMEKCARAYLRLSLIRARLEEDTGHRELHTADDVNDAARMYSANSYGARVLLALLRVDGIFETDRVGTLPVRRAAS